MLDEGRAGRLRSHVIAAENRVIVGHVVDLKELETRFVVELWLDGWPVRLTRANLFDEALFDEGVGDGCYRFRFVLDAAMARTGGIVEARLANSGVPLGAPISVSALAGCVAPEAGVRWAGGLRLNGWIGAPPSDPTPLISALAEGQVVAEGRASYWKYMSDGVAATPVRAFEIDLPPSLADGRARRIRVVDQNGRDLPGSPVSVLAFADGLERFCVDHAEIESERPRGAIYDALFPRSHPLRDFANWAKRFPPRVPIFTGRPKAVVALVGPADPTASLESLETQLRCDWVATGLGAAGPCDFPPEDLQALVAEEAGDVEFIVFAPAGVVFQPSALAHFAASFEAHPDAKIVYTDVSVLATTGEEWPIALTAFDYERMLEQGYAGLCFAVRRSHAVAAAAAGVSDLFSLFLLALQSPNGFSVRGIAHAPGFLVRLPALDLDAAAESLRRAVEAYLTVRQQPATTRIQFGGRFPAVKVERKPPAGRVTVIVTTRDSQENLRAFLDAFHETTRGIASDLIVVDVDSTNHAALEYLEEVGGESIRAARMTGPYQPERAYNAAANLATGEFLLFCSDDMRPVRDGWLSEMLQRMAEPNVGVVTPMLLWPSGIVQQCGLVVGPDFAASRAFRDLPEGDLGYGEMLGVAHEVGAASAVGMLTRRQLFLDLGGFDVQRYGLKFAAVDYCLKARALENRVVATPHAQLSRSRLDDGPDPISGEVGDRAWRELETLRFVWGPALENDPLYNPLLAVTGAPFSALAWPPRGLETRFSTLPKPKPWPEGL
jgi:hypothetical protein